MNVKKMNEVAKFVREKGEVSLYEICAKFDISFSTAYHYARLLPFKFEDIRYERGKLKKIEDKVEE